MNTTKRKYYILPLIAIATFAFSLVSCSKMDDYKDFVKDGEISYTGKIENVQVHPGNNRILLTGLLKSDPKVTTVKLYWNSESDSSILPVKRSLTTDTVRFLLENMGENVHSFTFYTFDSLGNTSIAVSRSGKVYGERYIASLTNRVLSSTVETDSGLIVIWGESNYLDGVINTEVVYTNSSDEQITLYQAPIEKARPDTMRVDTMLLRDYKEESEVYYRTLYLPDSLCIDTFSTDLKLLKLKEDVTAQYLENTSTPIQYDTWDGNRWGTLANWVVNDAAKNHGGYGGYEYYKNSGIISFEAGSGAPAIVNGKIYQTINLPAGNYSVKVDIIANDISSFKFIVVGNGSELPDYTDIADEAIAFADIAAEALEFSLSEAAEISLGFVFDLPSAEFCKISSIKLFKH